MVDYLPTYCRFVLYSLILSTKSFCTGSSSLNATAVTPIFLLKWTEIADCRIEDNLKSLWRIMVILSWKTSTRMLIYFNMYNYKTPLNISYSGNLIVLIATELKVYQNSVNSKNSFLAIALFPSPFFIACFYFLKALGPRSC